MSIRNLTNDVEERYLTWLCNILANGGRIDRVRRSEKMLRSLFYESFHQFIPNDDNRADEGRGLRVTYENDTEYKLDRRSYLRPCSVLEMLIALSERMAFQIFNPMKESEPDVAGCFWEIAENLQLRPAQSNAHIVKCLLNREYDENGLGGMFPLENNEEDQRAVEIWYQMMAYLIENY